MELLGEIFYGGWYWYTLTKCKKNYKLKKIGWNSIQKVCFFTFV